jgi:Tfp pilus assembly major pilin PilA
MNTQSSPTMEDFYRAAVGAKRADYYVPKFLRFDQPGASKASWNWPAFFVALFWGLYRRMYAYSLVFCFGVPLVIGIVFGLLLAVTHAPAVSLLFDVAVVAYTYVLIPMFANALYHKAILRRIKEIQAKVEDPSVQIAVLENGVHTSSVGWVIALFMFVPITGILAAIAIPAYQDYTIRAQVTEGLILSAPLERAIVYAYSANGAWPSDLGAVKFDQPVSGNYVTAIEVSHGTILIRFGNHANSLIAGQVLTLRPTLSERHVIWTCGYAAPQEGDVASSPSGVAHTTVPMKVLPAPCRS